MPPEGADQFLRPATRVGESLPNILFLQIRIGIEDFGMGTTCGDQSHDHAHGHAHTAQAGLTSHDLRATCYAIEIGHAICLIVAWSAYRKNEYPT
jgi:hypothetical protein